MPSKIRTLTLLSLSLLILGFQNCSQKNFSTEIGPDVQASLDSPGSAAVELTERAGPEPLPEEPTPKLGNHAFFGVWEYGNIYGEDPFMCGERPHATAYSRDPSAYDNPQINCKAETIICKSGIAIAARVFDINGTLAVKATPDDISALARELGASISEIKTHVIRAWEYRCVESG